MESNRTKKTMIQHELESVVLLVEIDSIQSETLSSHCQNHDHNGIVLFGIKLVRRRNSFIHRCQLKQRSTRLVHISFKYVSCSF